MTAATAASPCIRLCVLDDAAGLCRGCGRTLDEIAAWGSMSQAERLAIMARLAVAGSPGRKVPAGQVTSRP